MASARNRAGTPAQSDAPCRCEPTVALAEKPSCCELFGEEGFSEKWYYTMLCYIMGLFYIVHSYRYIDIYIGCFFIIIVTWEISGNSLGWPNCEKNEIDFSEKTSRNRNTEKEGVSTLVYILHTTRQIITTSLRPHHRWWLVRGVIPKWP